MDDFMTTLKAFVRRNNPMARKYQKWFSPHLQRDMEFLVFGFAGQPMLFFPTRMAHFYDYEDWGVIKSLEEKINAGKIQIFCLDSVDGQSFYCKQISPAERMHRHNLFEKYILFEVIPYIKHINKNNDFISAGCSLGAYHAVNLAFRYPHYFKKVIGLSGRYDLTIKLPHFNDLFDGYWDENIYYNMPGQFLKNLKDESVIQTLKNLEVILAIGEEDAFLDSNIQLNKSLLEKHIPNALHIFKGEAHKARYWSEMLPGYL